MIIDPNSGFVTYQVDPAIRESWDKPAADDLRRALLEEL
jgi:hypothetical protein